MSEFAFLFKFLDKMINKRHLKIIDLYLERVPILLFSLQHDDIKPWTSTKRLLNSFKTICMQSTTLLISLVSNALKRGKIHKYIEYKKYLLKGKGNYVLRYFTRFI